MRLIDADALKKKLFVFDMEFHDGHHQKYYVYKEKDVDENGKPLIWRGESE